jgi:hypothetical protein
MVIMQWSVTMSIRNRERRKSFFARNSSSYPTASILALTLLAGGFVLISPSSMTAALSQEEENNTTLTATSGNNNTTTATSVSGIELSPQPIYQERARTLSETPINQIHMSITFSGNGTLTLPNNTSETIKTTSNGSALTSLTTQSAQGTETIMTEDGKTATATFWEIVEFNSVTPEAKGIVIAMLHTNPTGSLAPLNGMIVAGIDEIQPNGESLTTFWEWKSGIRNLDIASVHGESPMDTTTT